MAEEIIEALVEGGKATAGPPLGPALGPMGVNIGQVIAKINEKTSDFKGMQVPVKVIIDTESKEFDITVGTPPASALIKQEAEIKSGASNQRTDKVADVKIEQVIKIAKMKESSLLGADTKARVKEIIGTCNGMGVMVEGVSGAEAIKLVNEGKFDEKIASGKTELSAEEMKELEEEKKRLAKELEERRAEFETIAKGIAKEMEGKPRNQIKAKMVEAEVPATVYEEFLPAEEAKEGAPAEK